MNGSTARFFRLAVSMAGLVTLGWVLTGQAAKPVMHRVPLATDWSHRHLVFSQPRSAEELARVSDDPRYWQQMARLAARQRLTVPMPQGIRKDTFSPLPRRWGAKPHGLQRDWSEGLGSGGALPANAYPGKYSYDINTASCASDTTPDFVVYSTGLLSSGGQASVVAYDNLYTGCSGATKPLVYWAYDTGGQVLTSPVFSEDGSQVAFVETNGGFGILVLLKWAASTTESVTSPKSLIPVALSAYRICSAPCMTEIDLADRSGTQTDDTTSSIFYDFAHDIGWVGGALGWLHKITGMFNGTPAEVSNTTFPVHLNNTTWLSSPVYDKRTTNVFVGDASGILYSVDATAGTVISSTKVDFGTGIVDAPIVDSAGQVAYAFISDDGSGQCAGGADCAAVVQFSTSFPQGNGGSPIQVGKATALGVPLPSPLYSGGLDTPYLKSQNATGNLYVCGNTGGTPILYQIPIAAGVMGSAKTTSITPLQLSNTVTTPCSPVSDIPNTNSAGTTDSIFASAQTDGANSNCASGGCIFNFIVTEWQPKTTYAQNLEILDTNLNIEAVAVNGISGLNPPTLWNASVGRTTTDGSVVWQNLGPLNGFTPAAWLGTHAYTRNKVVIDSNNNLEICNVAGTSGSSTPAWMPNVGDITPDGSGALRWKNLGPNPSAALAAAGGTSGIIMDNIVGSGIMAGASQVYFSTLSSQTCSSGSGSCATQASSPGLN